jgi:mRNA-degrading endonuclease toxin of MazEF toxin-antitoxin module
MPIPRRGEVWWAVLDPVIGQELGGHIEGEPRPVVVVSADDMNTGPSGKVLVVPMPHQPWTCPRW